MAASRRLDQLMGAAGLGASVGSSLDWGRVSVTSVTADSRRVLPGSVFAAIPGANDDGSRYVAAAVAAGAAAVLSERALSVPDYVAAIQVRDVRSALARLTASFHELRPGQRWGGLKLLGVTGTNGKTTTCTLLRSILSAAGHRAGLLGTVRYDLLGETREAPWTTPPPEELSACLATAAGHGATHVVMEVSSHALSQSRCAGHDFAVGVFTNLTGDHLDYHENAEAYAAAKKRLFDDLPADAVAVVNGDDPRAEFMVQACRGRVLRFGWSKTADVGATVQDLSTAGTEYVLRFPDGSATTVRSVLVGRHNVENALAAAGAAWGIGMGLESIRRGLEDVTQVRGRLERVASPARDFSVFVDYAHTDDALRKVLSALRPLTAGRLICVFGCGGDRDRSKRPRMARAVAERADVAVVTSDNPRRERPGAIIDEICAGFSPNARCSLQVVEDRREAIGRAIRSAGAGDTVLIAGKGHEDYQIVGDTKCHCDDVETAAEFLQGRTVTRHDVAYAG